MRISFTARLLIAASALTLFGVGQSQAAFVYTATRSIGTGSANISITTDQTIGVLTAANVIDWTIAMTDGPDSFTLRGPLSAGTNSQVLVVGTAFTATANDLMFNFNAGGTQTAGFQSPFIGSGKYLYAAQTNDAFDNAGPAEAIDPRPNFSFTKSVRSGNFVIASVANAPANPVPAPAGLLLGLTGLPIFGVVARLRRRNAVQA